MEPWQVVESDVRTFGPPTLSRCRRTRPRTRRKITPLGLRRRRVVSDANDLAIGSTATVDEFGDDRDSPGPRSLSERRRHGHLPRWRNWQTRWLQVPVGATPWRFESSPGHLDDAAGSRFWSLQLANVRLSREVDGCETRAPVTSWGRLNKRSARGCELLAEHCNRLVEAAA